MQAFMNDFGYFTSQFFQTIKSFFNTFINGSILGEIFLFVIIASLFLFLIEELISLGGGN